MRPVPCLVTLLPAVPTFLAHLVGVVVVVILLIRQGKQTSPAVLGLVGFGLLLALDVANLARGPLINALSRRTTISVRLAMTGVGCCCSVLDTAAVACLIAGIWQAVAGAKTDGADQKNGENRGV